ncbi:MAG: efflux RND transporter periplasmic adaptor subunit [Pseudomonadota bacterium]
MKVSSSVLTALAIFGVVAAYFVFRSLFAGGGATDDGAEATAPLFTVVVDDVAPTPWRDEIVVRGRTEALRKVTVRAETPGAIAQTPAREGAVVKKGDILCQLRVDARRAAVNEADASVAKASLDYDAALALEKDGFQAATAVATRKAALDQARAALEQARLELTRTDIVAPFDGVFDERTAEVGDFLKVGEPCGVVIQNEPFLVSGAVSERDVAKINVGDKGAATLATGERIEGAVRFVAASADARTRTFRVELEIPNPEGSLRDGVTADFTVFAARREAYNVPRSALTLNDNGVLSVRHVVGGDTVEDVAVAILGEDAQGVWIDGLEGTAALITRGQDNVRDGQKVAVASGAAGAARTESVQ